MNNRVSTSPITLAPIADAWSSIPEVPFAVQDGFGADGIVVLQGGRWRGLIPRAGGNVFAWFADGEVRATGLSSSMSFGQIFESDADGRALVLGGTGNSLYAVEPSGAATCLGVLPNRQRFRTACWLPNGGVAAALESDVCIYTPGPDGRLRPRLRFRAVHPEDANLRSFAVARDDVFALVAMIDDRGAIYSIDTDGRVHMLADFEGLDMADVQLFLDETGNRTMLPDGAVISTAGSLATIDGLDDAIAMREQLPEAELSVAPAPELDAGPNHAAPSEAEAKIDVHASAPDAITPPSLDRLGRLTCALIRMLRAAPQRSAPDTEVLKLIREGMPDDLRAYLHAWATHVPSNPSVYEWWMVPPSLVTREFIRKEVGEAVQLGTFASGEPIVARLGGSSRCDVVMIDEEGHPYRYYGLEGFLQDLRMRASENYEAKFELDAWLG